jgi:hypothetical protein
MRIAPSASNARSVARNACCASRIDARRYQKFIIEPRRAMVTNRSLAHHEHASRAFAQGPLRDAQ